MTLQKTVTDARIVLEIKRPRWKIYANEGARAKDLEYTAKELEEFLRDHRSLDTHSVYVDRDYAYKCEHCDRWTDEFTNNPECCQKALDEYDALSEKIA